MIRRRIGKLFVSGLELAGSLPIMGKPVAELAEVFCRRFLEPGAYGEYLLKNRKPVEAEARFRDALADCNTDAQSIAGLTEALREQGRAKEITAELLCIAKLIPDSQIAKRLPFQAHESRALLDDPCLMEQMRQFVAKFPGAFSATLLLAFAEARNGNIVKSTELFESLTHEYFLGKQDLESPKARPKFLILGQNKAATTSLFGHICSHSLMVRPLLKEPNYFSRNFRYGSSWYESQFPRLSLESKKFTGESSTSYLLHRAAPGRVHGELPDVKLIVMLRDPVSRAYSEYCMNWKSNDANLGFSEAANRIMEEYPYCPIDDSHFNKNDDRIVFKNSIALSGLKRWLEYFPTDQLLVLHQKDFLRDTPGILRRVCRFLDVPYFRSTAPRMLHVGRYPPLDEAIRKKLQIWYRPHEDSLRSFLESLPESCR